MVEQPVEPVEQPVEPVEQSVELEVEPSVETKSIKKERPKTMVTCPDCNKTMLEKTFRYKHINICSKPKVVKAKPIEQLIEEKKFVQQPIATPKAKPKAKARAKTQPTVQTVVSPPTQQPTAIEPRTNFWESRRQHLNLLNEKKAVTVKKIMAKAF